MLYSPDESPMSSTVPYLNAATLSIVLHLAAIFVLALLLNRFLRVLTNLLIKPAARPIAFRTTARTANPYDWRASFLARPAKWSGL